MMHAAGLQCSVHVFTAVFGEKHAPLQCIKVHGEQASIKYAWCGVLLMPAMSHTNICTQLCSGNIYLGQVVN